MHPSPFQDRTCFQHGLETSLVHSPCKAMLLPAPIRTAIASKNIICCSLWSRGISKSRPLACRASVLPLNYVTIATLKVSCQPVYRRRESNSHSVKEVGFESTVYPVPPHRLISFYFWNNKYQFVRDSYNIESLDSQSYCLYAHR